MSKSVLEQDWINKKISDGYYGFNVASLHEIYNEKDLDKLKEFFNNINEDLKGITVETLKNSRRGVASFALWFLKHLEQERDEDGNRYVSDVRLEEFRSRDWNRVFYNNVPDTKNLDDLIKKDIEFGETDDTDENDRPILYDYGYIRDVFEYFHNSILTPEQIRSIKAISDLSMTLEPTNISGAEPIFVYEEEDEKSDGTWGTRLEPNKKYRKLTRGIDEISKDVIRHLYDDNLDGYRIGTQHINIIPPYGIMAPHTDDTTDNRDYTIIIYVNTDWEEKHQGLLTFYVPAFSLNDIKWKGVHDMYGKFWKINIEPMWTNIVVMNHAINDNTAGLIAHGVGKNMSTKPRYSIYTTYIKNKSDSSLGHTRGREDKLWKK